MPKRIWINPIIPPSFPFSTHPSILLFPLPHFRSHPFFFSSFSSAFFVSFLPSPSSPHIKSLSEQPHWCFFSRRQKSSLSLLSGCWKRRRVCVRRQSVVYRVCVCVCASRVTVCVFTNSSHFSHFLSPALLISALPFSVPHQHTHRHAHKNHLPSYWMTSSNGI